MGIFTRMQDEMIAVYAVCKSVLGKEKLTDSDRKFILGLLKHMMWNWAQSNAHGRAMEDRARERGVSLAELMAPMPEYAAMVERALRDTLPENWDREAERLYADSERFTDILDYYDYGSGEYQGVDEWPDGGENEC